MNLHTDRWTARARALLRTIRHAPDRLLHGPRRWWLRRRLRRRGLPRAVMFVCHGNICRSPYAQHAFFQRLPPELQDYMYVVSAGFVGPGRSTPAHGIAEAAARGVDLAAHSSQLVSADLVRHTDLVVVMDARQARLMQRHYGADARRVVVLGDLDPLPIETRAVRDPILQPASVFAESYERIDRCVVALLRLLETADGVYRPLSHGAYRPRANGAVAPVAGPGTEAEDADTSGADTERVASAPAPRPATTPEREPAAGGTASATAPVAVRIRFQNYGGDNQGALLDVVRLRRP